MVDKIFQVAPVESLHSLSGTEVGLDVGNVDGSWTWDAYADINYKYTVTPNLSFSARVTTLYLDPPASALHPDTDRNPFLISEEKPSAFASFNRIQAGAKISGTGHYAKDFQRKKMIDTALKMPTIKEVMTEKNWNLSQLQENWTDFIHAVAQTQLLASGMPLEMINNDTIVHNLALSFQNEFSRLNPDGKIVANARTLEEAKACVEYMSNFLKKIQAGELKTTRDALAKQLEGKKEEDGIYEARYIELIAGLVDAAAHQGPEDFGFRYRHVFMGEPIPNGATSYGLGAALKGAFAFDPFDAHRKTLEFSARLAVQQPGRLYIYKEKDDGKMIDPKTGVANVEAAVEVSPWKFLSFIVKGGVSQGWDELKDASSAWYGAEVKIRAIDEEKSSLVIVPGFINGSNGELETFAAGADILWDIRKGYDKNNLSLNLYFAYFSREVGKMEKGVKQVKDAEGETASQGGGAVSFNANASAQEQLMIAPSSVTARIREEGKSAGIEITWRNPGGIYKNAFVKLNAGIVDGGMEVFADSPETLAEQATGNVGVEY